MSNDDWKDRLERWVEAWGGTISYDNARLDDVVMWKVTASGARPGVNITVEGTGDSMEVACKDACLRLDIAGISLPE